MAKCEIAYVFEEGQICSDSWLLSDSHHDDAMTRLKRIANSRAHLLGKNVAIVRLKATGHKSEQVDLKGTGGHANSRYSLRLISDQYSANDISLRGVPSEFFIAKAYSGCGLSEAAKRKVANFGKTLVECGAFLIRHGETRPIGELYFSGRTVHGYKKDQHATLGKLEELLGKDRAAPIWAKIKERKAERKRRLDPPETD